MMVNQKVGGRSMPVLRIEHSVPDYDVWKRAFDSDPADRKGSGVTKYQIFRSADDPKYVLIDLEFASQAEAEGLLETMRRVWAGPGKDVMMNPQARIVESMETVEL
jgi:hypothetical protein